MKTKVKEAATIGYDLFGEAIIQDPLLRERFMEVPFSVLDTKTASWQTRRRMWIAKGIKSEVGRDGNLTFAASAQSPGVYEFRNKLREEMGRDPTWEEITEKSKEAGINLMTGTSIFDPALTELLYHWFCPSNGLILDCFAGGSVRGIVGNYLGYKYTGIELRPEQVDANRENALEILDVNNQPQWYQGDSDQVLDGDWKQEFDFLFSCPPYFNLEIYSDYPEDLSNMPYDLFQSKYRSIIKKAVRLLKPESYACFVVSPIRTKFGFYINLVGETVDAFAAAGCGFYNDAILLNAIGSAAIRANRQFRAGQKLVRIHQNVLIFKKI
mgnify:FL=1